LRSFLTTSKSNFNAVPAKINPDVAMLPFAVIVAGEGKPELDLICVFKKFDHSHVLSFSKHSSLNAVVFFTIFCFFWINF